MGLLHLRSTPLDFGSPTRYIGGPTENFGGPMPDFRGSREHFRSTTTDFGGPMENLRSNLSDFGGSQVYFGSKLRGYGEIGCAKRIFPSSQNQNVEPAASLQKNYVLLPCVQCWSLQHSRQYKLFCRRIDLLSWQTFQVQ